MPTPIDHTVSNLFTLQRLGNGLDRKSREVLEKLFREVVAELIRIDPMGVSGRYRAKRLRKLLEELRPVVQSNMIEWRKIMRQELAEIGAQQSTVARATLSDALGGPQVIRGLNVTLDRALPGVNFFKTILDTDPFRGLTLQEWADRQTAKVRADLTAQIRLGMTAGETIPQITKRMRGAIETTKHGAEAIARTAVNHVATTSRFETFSRHDTITSEWEFVATLDTHTTPVCIRLDRTRHRYDDPTAPKPPRHFGCRSSVTPIINYAALGLPEPAGGFRMSEGGKKVGREVSYEGWLRTQSLAKQVEVLGATRARAFRGGKSLMQLIKADGTWVHAADLAA